MVPFRLTLNHVFVVPKKATSTIDWHLYSLEQFITAGSTMGTIVLCSRRSWKADIERYIQSTEGDEGASFSHPNTVCSSPLHEDVAHMHAIA